MANKDILLVTKNKTTAALVKGCLNAEYNIIEVKITEIDDVLKNKKGLFFLIIDLSDDDIEYIKKYVFLHLEHELLQILAITNTIISSEAPSINKLTAFWGLDPDNTAELVEKIEQFKNYRVSTLARVRILETVFDKTPVGFAIIPTNRDYQVFLNASFCEIIGYSKEEYVELGWNKLTHPEDAYIDQYIQRKVNEGQGHATIRKRIIKKDGRSIWIEQSLDIVNRRDDGSYIRVVMIRDISERKQLEQNLEELNRSQEALFRKLPGLVYRSLWQKEGGRFTLEFVSEGARMLTGYEPAELMWEAVAVYNDLVLAKHKKSRLDAWEKAIIERSAIEERYQIKMKNGDIKWVVERGAAVYDEHGKVVALEGVIFDITHSKNLEEQVRYYHEYDQRFHLPNRSQLTKRVQEALEQQVTAGTILLINLKDTQKLYRSQGHEYVELLSASLVNKLKTLQSNKMALYYVEEDIYVFYSNTKLEYQEVIDFYCSIKEAIIKTITREQVRCYIGVLFLSKQTLTSEEALQKSRLASEFTRDEEQIIGLSYFDEEMEALIKREDTIKRELLDLSYSADFGALRLVFQPIVDLKNGKTIAFEALARYTSPVYGVITPSEFIPIVEKNRMIISFGRKINQLAMIFTKELIDNGIDGVRVGINVSPLQLLDAGFVTSILKIANEYEVPPSRIVIEMTETIFSANYELLDARLDELRFHGFRIALDDFGTGFSSLSLVSKLDFETIKIDKSFVDELNRKTVATSIIPEIISMCKKFDIASLAEGIETSEQYNHLRELGCTYGQGYFMARPMEKEVALKYIKDEKGGTN